MAVSTPSVERAQRPSLVVAEALVDRQNPSEIQARARELGLSPLLTETVVSVCCGTRPGSGDTGTAGEVGCA